MNKSKKQEYSFPILKLDDLLNDINRLNIVIPDGYDINRNSLFSQNRNPIVISAIYEFFVEILQGVSRQELMDKNNSYQYSFEAKNHFNDSLSIFSDALVEQEYTHALVKMMYAAGIVDFTMDDVINPSPTRTRRILSALINFGKFREERLNEFEKYNEENEKLSKEEISVRDENQKLINELQLITKARDDEEPEHRSLEERAIFLRDSVNELNESQAIKREKMHKLLKTRKDLGDKLVSTKLSIDDAETAIERVQSQIVDSPKKMVKRIENLNAQLEIEKQKLTEKENTLTQALNKSKRRGELEQQLKKTIKLLEETEVDINKYRELVLKQKDNRARAKEFDARLEELSITEQHKKRELSSGNEKLVSMKKKAQIKLEAIEKAYEIAKQEYENMKKSTLENRNVLSELTEKVYKIESKTNSLKMAHEKALSDIKEQYTSVEADFIKFNKEILATIE